MRLFVIGALALCVLPAGCETTSSEEFGVIMDGVFGTSGNATTPSGLSQFEIDAALRQALEISADRVASQLGVTDGYWRNDAVRIPLPGRLGDLQEQFSGTPLAGPLDDLQLRMNRAAEAAVPAGKTIVIDAVKAITIEDAIGLLNGGDTAATDFLRGKTETNLRDLFKPYVENALGSSGAYRSLDQVTGSNPLLSGYAGQFKDDLTNHAVTLGLDGVFDYLALEEKKIRDNPVARSTELLRRVFGAA